MAFFAYAEQNGGCDYTMGCGTRLVELSAQTQELAKVEAAIEFESYLSEGLKRVRIFEVVRVGELDLNDMRRAVQKRIEAAKKVEDEARERAEYERLKAKFGSP